MDDDFKVVVRAKRRQKFSKPKQIQTQQFGFEEGTQENEETNLPSVEFILKTLRDSCEEIKDTSFYKTFKDLLLAKMHLSSPTHMLKPSPTIDSTTYIQRSSFVPQRGEKNSNPSTNLESIESDECQEVIFGMENSQSSDETSSSQLPPQGNALLEGIKMPTSLELVIYGIGKFAECLIARYQLALMLALRDTLKLPCSSVHVFDPMLTGVEKSTIKELGLSLIGHNEEGKRPATDRCHTLFFMPHCGKALCNNLLWANWSPGQLSNLIIIGNSFSSLVERNPERLLKQYYYYIWKVSFFTKSHIVSKTFLQLVNLKTGKEKSKMNWIHSVTDETSLPNSFKHSDVFNDTSIHCFQSEELSKLPKDFWEEHTEPVYDSSDLEIIVNK